MSHKSMKYKIVSIHETVNQVTIEFANQTYYEDETYMIPAATHIKLVLNKKVRVMTEDGGMGKIVEQDADLSPWVGKIGDEFELIPKRAS